MQRGKKMMPIGPLMIEHRLIERMIRQIADRLPGVGEDPVADVRFIDQAVDFIRTYADRCHHGKEEDILFRELEKKTLTPDQRRVMDELVEEHVFGREKVAELVDARNRYAAGDRAAVAQIRETLSTIAAFYPEHIAKEDKGFFIPVMEHFTKEERDAMLNEGFDFDANLIHETYGRVVESLETGEG